MTQWSHSCPSSCADWPPRTTSWGWRDSPGRWTRKRTRRHARLVFWLDCANVLPDNRVSTRASGAVHFWLGAVVAPCTDPTQVWNRGHLEPRDIEVLQLASRAGDPDAVWKAEKATAPCYNALSTKVGCECIVHILTVFTDLFVNTTVVTTDGVGAYDLISRNAMMEGIVRMEDGDRIIPVCAVWKGKPTRNQNLESSSWEEGVCRVRVRFTATILRAMTMMVSHSTEANNHGTRQLVEAGFAAPDWAQLVSGDVEAPHVVEEEEPNQPRKGWQATVFCVVEAQFWDCLFPTFSNRDAMLLRLQEGLDRSCRIDPQPFRILLLRRLRFQFLLFARSCRLFDNFGHHPSACAVVGIFGRRGHFLMIAAARICREAGGRVRTNVFRRELELGVGGMFDNRRGTDSFPLFNGAQLAVDTTLVSVCHPPWRLFPTQGTRGERDRFEARPTSQEHHVPRIRRQRWGGGGGGGQVCRVRRRGWRPFLHWTSTVLQRFGVGQGVISDFLRGRARSAWTCKWNAMLGCAVVCAYAISWLDGGRGGIDQARKIGEKRCRWYGRETPFSHRAAYQGDSHFWNQVQNFTERHDQNVWQCLRTESFVRGRSCRGSDKVGQARSRGSEHPDISAFARGSDVEERQQDTLFWFRGARHCVLPFQPIFQEELKEIGQRLDFSVSKIFCPIEPARVRGKDWLIGWERIAPGEGRFAPYWGVFFYVRVTVCEGCEWERQATQVRPNWGVCVDRVPEVLDSFEAAFDNNEFLVRPSIGRNVVSRRSTSPPFKGGSLFPAGCGDHRFSDSVVTIGTTIQGSLRAGLGYTVRSGSSQVPIHSPGFKKWGFIKRDCTDRTQQIRSFGWKKWRRGWSDVFGGESDTESLVDFKDDEADLPGTSHPINPIRNVIGAFAQFDVYIWWRSSEGARALWGRSRTWWEEHTGRLLDEWANRFAAGEWCHCWQKANQSPAMDSQVRRAEGDATQVTRRTHDAQNDWRFQVSCMPHARFWKEQRSHQVFLPQLAELTNFDRRPARPREGVPQIWCGSNHTHASS